MNDTVGDTQVSGANNSERRLETRAISGIKHCDALLDGTRSHAPLHRLTTIEEVGATAACVMSDFARSVSGNIAYIDGGHHVV